MQIFHNMHSLKSNSVVSNIKSSNKVMSILKRRCQSLPQFRRKIYSKIGKNYQQQQWKIFLKNQHQLSSALQQFTKVQFDIKNQDNFKFTTRSILMMKREIIKYLQRNELQEGLKKLKDLEEKVNANQIKKVKMMIIYLECRQEMEKGLTNGKEEAIICRLKEKMNQFINGNETTLIKIKILTILSILLLRFHGILMTNDQKLIIFKTIDLKKKIILQIDRKQQKQSQFQCLLYLLLQLYKILYLLKKDQQTILFYYNQLHAYTQIYLKRQQNKEDLDVNEIQKVLTNMKPILNQLDIYEDTKLRKELAFAHIQQQVIEQQNSSSKYLEQKKQQERKRISSNIKISSSNKIIRRSNNLQNGNRLTLGLSSLKREISIESCIENVHEIEKYPIYFQFLVVSQEQLFVAALSFKLRNACNLVDCEILIKRGNSFREIFRLTGIQLIASSLNFKSISRFLFKMMNHFLQTTTQFQQINNIYYMQQKVPKNMVSDDLITSFCRIKTIIATYIRQNHSNYSLIGKKFHFPIVTKHSIQLFIQNLTQLQKKRAKQMFSRRQGFILQQKYTYKPHTQKCVKILMKRQMEKTLQYYFINILFQHIFKGIQIYYLNQNDQQVQIGEKINLLKKINDWILINHRKMIRKNVIRSMLSLQIKLERASVEIKQYRVEEQLQINQQRLKSEIITVKSQSTNKIKMKKPQLKKQFEMVKMQKSYFLFLRQNIGDSILYKNDKAKLFLPSNWKQRKWQLSKVRLRLYKSIKTHIHTGKQKKYIKYCGQEMVKTCEQYIALVLLKHKVLLRDKGYSILLIYRTPLSQYLYEIIYNKHQRFYYIAEEELEISQREQQDKLLKRYSFYPYQGMRQKISEANWYYLNIAKKKQTIP